MATAMPMRPPLPPLSDRIRGGNRITIARRSTPDSFQLRRCKSREETRASFSRSPRLIAKAQKQEERRDDAEESPPPSYSVLAAMRSEHNDIVVVDTPDSRVLLLDSTHNIHSMLNKEQKWTGSYWDEFASLPAIIPKGPIAILGLGAGTAAHLLLDLWPSLHIEGWEIDEILVDMSRDYFGLSALERCTEAGGSLSVHIGDALSPSVAVQGGFAGIIVDLFSDGKVLPQLQEDAVWLEIEKKLMPHGRIMVNCGGAHAEMLASSDQMLNPHASLSGSWIQNSTVRALCRVFPGKLTWKRMEEKDSDNYLALTGPLPDLDAWSTALPSPLNSNVKHWRPCELAS
ncbi:uncharacterized protein A4U43_C10F2560 [Asparagus officinalis]|uniref:PABS domain-containing protein n=1 Tax=Asparagus officinalis TaxID=4686 RepID=A0A5P1E3B8_ASPOF|nr:uncharacterized protein LOC109825059 [Asparagus officinalis]ONK55945.1 uncharacterized protein A4U43_C10F2560 [Asparagus officinalis]